MLYFFKRSFLFVVSATLCFNSLAQFRPKQVNWTEDGNYYTSLKEGSIVRTDPRTGLETILIKRELLTPAGSTTPLSFRIYNFSADNTKLLIYTNTARVWRYNTRGDYWVLDIPSGNA